MLTDEIVKAQRLVRTDAYQMSVGEIVTMYDNSEIIVDPEFQRLFRWDISQESKLIESLLLGIPLPSIFVFEKENDNWELIDGLQRVSTILEFMGSFATPMAGWSHRRFWKLRNTSRHSITQYGSDLNSLLASRLKDNKRSKRASSWRSGGRGSAWRY
jgi:Protein of unknown function DUF262